MINNSWIDGYKTLFITFITILSAGAVYWFSPDTANVIQLMLFKVVMPLGIIIAGIFVNGAVASYTREKLLSIPRGLRRMVDKTPLSGPWEPIIDAAGALAIALIAFFFKNAGQADTLTQLVSQVFVPLAILIAGGQAVAIHINQSKLKIAPVVAAVTTGNTAAPTPVPITPVPPLPPTPPGFPAAEDYAPINIDDLIAQAEARIKKNGGTVSDLARAYNFTDLAKYIDCFTIPKEYRIVELIRLCSKCVALFTTAFISYTKIPTPPTPEQAREYYKYQGQLKEDYMAANNLPCGHRTFEELKSLIEVFNELYSAQYGLTQENGKVCDWSIYGTGGTTHGFVEVGQDWVELTT